MAKYEEMGLLDESTIQETARVNDRKGASRLNIASSQSGSILVRVLAVLLYTFFIIAAVVLWRPRCNEFANGQ